MMILNLNNQTSFASKNEKLLKSLEYRAKISNSHAPELREFYNNSAKFIKKDIKKKEFLKNTSDTINILNNKHTLLDKQEAYFFRHLTQTFQFVSKTKIPTEYLKNLLKIFTPTDGV